MKYRVELISSKMFVIDGFPDKIRFKCFKGVGEQVKVDDPTWGPTDQLPTIKLSIEDKELPVLRIKMPNTKAYGEADKDFYIAFDSENSMVTQFSLMSYINQIVADNQKKNEEASKNRWELNRVKAKYLDTRQTLSYMLSLYNVQLNYYDWNFIFRLMFQNRIKQIKQIKRQIEFLIGVIDGQYNSQDIEKMYHNVARKFLKMRVKNSKREEKQREKN